MSRVPKWKFDKTKVKVVFRLQFHATNIPQSGWDKLFVSFIPADIGKATAKTNKANVRNGNCKWADPVYETTRLLQDTNTKKYDEKLYKLVVAMGTSRSSLLGEAYINLADYADASKPISVALPLDGCEFATILHVTVQLLTSKTGFREFEQQREVREKGFHQISNQNQESPRKMRDSAEKIMDQIDKVNARVRFKPESTELHLLEEAGGLNEDFEDSAAGLDGSSCTSDSICAEKIDISGTHETEPTKITISGEVGRFPSVQNTQSENKEKAEYHLLAQGSSEWAHGWSSDYSVDNELSVYDENARIKRCLETTESSLSEMKMEINSLQSLADELGAETQRLTHQFVSELASGELLSKEVSVLKSECLKLKVEFEAVKDPKRRIDDIKVIQATGIKQLVPVESQLDKEQDDKNLMKEKICKLLTELEDSKAEQEALTNKMNQMGCYYEALIHELEERNKDTLNELENIRVEHCSCLSTISAFPGQIEKMHQDMNEQFLKLAEDKWYLESLNKELEKRAVASETALKRARWTYSIAVDRLQKDLELLSVQVLSMFETNENLAKQAFAEASKLYLDEHPQEHPELIQSYLKNDLQPPFQQVLHKSSDLERQQPMPIKNEIGATPMFSSAPLKYKLGQSFDPKSDNRGAFFSSVPTYADLQTIKDVSVAHVNGSKAEQTCPVVTSPMPINGKRSLVSCTEEFAGALKNDEFRGYTPVLKPIMDSKEFNAMWERHKLDMEIELSEVHMLNVQMEVFSKVLQETLWEKKFLVRNMKEQMDELSQQLKCSTKSEELLMLKLQTALDDVRILREDVVKFSAKCDDLIMEKYILEAKLQDTGDETSFLVQKLAESERWITELKVYESNYSECNAEKLILKNLLKEESLQKNCLQSELKSMVEEYNAMKVELDKESSARDDLEGTVDLLGERLRCLCSNVEPFVRQIHVPDFASASLEQKLGNKDYLAVMSHIEQLQLGAYKKILKLSQEKEEIEEEKDALQRTLKDKESQVLSIKHNSDSVLADVVTKLGQSDSLVEKLKSELQDVETKLETKAESEKLLLEKNGELTSKLTVMGYKLLDAANENRDFSQRLLEFDNINKELEMARANAINCRAEEETLMFSLHSVNEANFQLENELNKINEQLRYSNAELQTERGTREKLEETASSLILQLNEKNEQIVSLEETITDLTLQLNEKNEQVVALYEQILSLEEAITGLTLQLNEKNEQIVALNEQTGSLEEAITGLTLQLNEKNEQMVALNEQIVPLEETITGLSFQLNDKNEQMVALDEQKSELAHLRTQVSNFESEKSGMQRLLLHHQEHQRNVDVEMSSLHDKVGELENELHSLKEALKSKHDAMRAERCFREEMEDKVTDLTFQLSEKCDQLLHFNEQKSELACLSQKLLDLQSEKSAMEQLLLDSKECRKELDAQISILNSQVTNLDHELNKGRESLEDACKGLHSEKEIREKLEAAVSDLTSLLNEKQEQLLHFGEQKVELAHLRQQVLNLESEKSVLENLLLSSKERINELDTQISAFCSQVTNLHTELSSSRESLFYIENELQSERDIRVKLEATVSDLTSMLNEKQEQLVSFGEEKAELILLRQHVSDLESEKSERQLLLFLRDELHSKIGGENSFLHVQVTELETQLEELHYLLLTADIEAIFTRSQYQTNMTSLQELFGKFKNLEEQHEKLHRNQLDVVANLQNCMASKERYLKENARLSTALQLLKSDCTTDDHIIDSMHERTVMSEKVQNFQVGTSELGDNDFQQKHHFQREIEPLKVLLCLEEEMENLRSSRDEHEITGIVLRSKLHEQQEQITSLQECRSELISLQEQHSELMLRLSEQFLKTEEFKNLSIHLKELKDKADAECHQIRDKRESEGPSVAVQESLRVAFIKEQYETKLQELWSQLNISKKHGEEILLKLQNAIDEVEIRKKSEASHVKRNEELSIKVLELEAELQRLVMDRRALLSAHDKIKAELECSIISLDCCKEEKVKLEAYLRECNEDRKKVRVELDLTKRRLESLSSISDNQGSHKPDIPKSTSFGQLLEERNLESVQQQVGTVGGTYQREDAVIMDRNGVQVSIGGYAHLDLQLKEQSSEDGPECKGTPETSRHGSAEKGNLMQENRKYKADVKEQTREQHDLKASIERLHQELERMKNENLASLLPVNEQHIDPSLQGMEKGLLQLDVANEHLGTIFPSFNKLPGTGNALERVLALELELAESLQAKKKSEFLFQSSFLRQHSDEEAIFQSFRDINELIKDMLDLKGKYAAVETELKEMQNRYSQLSLQFAEVEGERQKLIMTLKNIRSPKKAQS